MIDIGRLRRASYIKHHSATGLSWKRFRVGIE